MSKKILSVLLVFALLFALTSVSALADPPTGSITVQNNNPNVSIVDGIFSAYIVFNATTDGLGGYSYTLHSNFAGFETEMGYDPLARVFAIQEDIKNTTNLAGMTLEEFSADLAKYINIVNTAVPGTIDPTEIGLGIENPSSPPAEIAVIEDLLFGYYLVTGEASADSLGGGDGYANIVIPANILVTVDGDEDVILKADAPKFEKKVWDVKDITDPDNTLDPRWQDVTDVNIGATVIFKLEAQVPDTQYFEEYTFNMHDRLSRGLTLDPASIKVYLGGTLNASGGVTGGTLLSAIGGAPDYTLHLWDGTHGCPLPTDPITYDDCTLGIEFNKIMDYPAGTKIYVIYEAELNQSAVVFDPGNLNSAWLEYSNNPYNSETNRTPEDKVVVYTFMWNIFKYADNGEDADPDAPFVDKLALKDAEFQLYTDPATTTGRTPLNLVRIDAGDATDPAIYRRAKTGETAGVTDTMVVPASGMVIIYGIDEGIYYLKETKPPIGYNALENDIVVKLVVGYTFDELNGYRGLITDLIDDSVSVSYFQTDSNTPKVIVKEVPDADPAPILEAITAWVLNNNGDKLPETGGIGTTIFTIGGLALMIAAGVVLMVRKKSAVRRRY